MEQCPEREQLRHFLSSQLPDPEQDTICEHVQECLACQQSLDVLVNAAPWHGNHSVPVEGPSPTPAFLDRLKSDPPDLSASSAGGGRANDDTLAILAPATQPGCLGRLGHYEVLGIGPGRHG